MSVYDDWESARKADGHAATVAHYNDLVQQLADQAKASGIALSDWDIVGALLDKSVFRRHGCFMEVQDWADYRAMMNDWVGHSTKFTTVFHRLTVADNVAFLELEENHPTGDINSVSIYNFDDAGRIARLQVYLQMAQ